MPVRYNESNFDLPSVRRRVESRRARNRERWYAAQIRHAAPELKDARFTPTLSIFAGLIFLNRNLADKIEQLGALDENDQPRGVVDTYLKTAGAALRYADTLGLTPAARAKLGLIGKSTQVFDLNKYRDDEVEDVETEKSEPTS